VKRLRLAVIGAGRLGGFHAQKAAANADIELVAVCDPRPDARDRVAADCGARPMTDHRSLPGKIDAAVIAAPTRLHHGIAMDLIGEGVHLLVEKPLCPTVAEADELVDAARRHGVILQVGHVERFNPAMEAARAYVPNPKYIEAVRASGFTFRSTDVGVVLDLMIHDIDLVLSLVDSPVRRVEALGLSVLGGHEDVANARLWFESGCVAALSASRVSRKPVRQMQVWSARGFADVDFGALTASVVRPSETLLRRQFDVDALSAAEVEHFREHLLDEHLPCTELRHERVDALALEQQDFVASIRGPRAPRVSGEQGRDAVAVAEQILGRIHAHAWDDDLAGPVGPMATPRPSVISPPHWAMTPMASPLERKEAG
jgi:predicted dehydrogenase